MAAVTREALSAVEDPLIEAIEAVRKIPTLLRQERETTKNTSVSYENWNHWGTIRVNATVLRDMLSKLLTTLP